MEAGRCERRLAGQVFFGPKVLSHGDKENHKACIPVFFLHLQQPPHERPSPRLHSKS